MVPKHMAEILDESYKQTKPVLGQFFDSEKMCNTKCMKDFIAYVDNLEAELIVRRAAGTKNAKVVTLQYSSKKVDIEPSQVV